MQIVKFNFISKFCVWVPGSLFVSEYLPDVQQECRKLPFFSNAVGAIAAGKHMNIYATFLHSFG